MSKERDYNNIIENIHKLPPDLQAELKKYVMTSELGNSNKIKAKLTLVNKEFLEKNRLSAWKLDELIGKKDNDILAPIGRGIYASAKLTSEELLVDIGDKNFVKKSIPETKNILQGQLKKLDKVKEELFAQNKLDVFARKSIEEIFSSVNFSMRINTSQSFIYLWDFICQQVALDIHTLPRMCKKRCENKNFDP
jgi:prefoldin subunit 5